MPEIHDDDEDIDYSDIPELDEDFWKNAVFWAGPKSDLLTLRLDPAVLNWFKQRGNGYKAQINAVLKSYAEKAMQQENVG